MSPYEVTASEVVHALASSTGRQSILRGWLNHRDALRNLGFVDGFQWLDGSFVENKEPNDLDIVTFIHRPPHLKNDQLLVQCIQNNLNLFDRVHIKSSWKLDAFFIDLDGSPESLVNASRYYLGLFSHRRNDGLWKGMLQVKINTATDDANALALLGPIPAASSASHQGTTP